MSDGPSHALATKPGEKSGLAPAAWRPWLDEFLNYLRVEARLAANSIAAYRRDLTAFLRWLGDVPAAPFSRETVQRYLAGESMRAKADSSRARAATALRVFTRFMVQDGLWPDDPLALLAVRQPQAPLPRVLSEAEVDRLLTCVGGDDWRAVRDRALLETLYSTGARVSELAGLQLTDLNVEQRTARLRGKGGKERVVYMGTRGQQALRDYLRMVRLSLASSAAKRTARAKAKPRRPALTGAVFLSKRGLPLRRESIWAMVKARAREAGIAASISPHTLRHSFASHMLAHGADLRVIQHLLGHESIATTQRYTHIDATGLHRTHQRFHPRA